MNQPICIAKEQARRFLVTVAGLAQDTYCGEEGILSYVRRVGCIQYDPLDVVGRNGDLVLQSRIAGYQKGDLDALLYEKRRLFDVWDKNMSIAPVEDWPYFSRFRQKYLPWCNEQKDAVNAIVQHLSQTESACSSDFDLEHKIDWHYGPQRLAKAALECMCYAGLAVVHHKKGTRRYYSLAQQTINPALFNREDPNRTLEDYHDFMVLRRMGSIGMLWNKPSDAWLGIEDFKSAQRNAAFERLKAKGEIVEIAVEGSKTPFYIKKGDLHALMRSAAPFPHKCAKILAPLDNLLWDRRLVSALFDFDYKWEVYTPAAERKYGYYVLPVLYGDAFVARFEPAGCKKAGVLRIKGWWWEQNVTLNEGINSAVNEALLAFCRYLGADEYEIEDVKGTL